MAQNGRVQLPRAFLVVILFGGELLTVLRSASLARAPVRLVARPCTLATAVPFWCPCIDSAIPKLRKSRQQSASLPFLTRFVGFRMPIPGLTTRSSGVGALLWVFAFGLAATYLVSLATGIVQVNVTWIAAISWCIPPSLPILPRRAWGASQRLSAMVAIPLFCLCRIPRADTGTGDQIFGSWGFALGFFHLVLPRPSSLVTTWRLLATGIAQVNATWIAAASWRILALAPCELKSSQSAEASLESRPCALSHSCSSAFLYLSDSNYKAAQNVNAATLTRCNERRE